MVQGLDISTLISLKLEALLHDPPHKSFLLTACNMDFKALHEKEAKQFRSIILNGTRFYGLPPQAERFVKIYDALASTVERKLVRYAGWPKGVYLPYDKLHNIFDPRQGIDLRSLLPQDTGNRIGRVAKELNNTLIAVDSLNDFILFYNTLYLLLEALWYVHDLPPALADTRVPTHTMFDHVYASAMMANIVGEVRGDYEPVLRGFYVLVDFPSVQKFVGVGRKAGDFWAASWLASNTMWGIADRFAFSYGFDVIVSPTPRLNPYAAKSLWSRVPKEIREKISRDSPQSSKFLEGLGRYALNPLVPATISMVLPQASTVQHAEVVLDMVKQAYVESWKSTVEDIISTTVSQKDEVSKLIYEKLHEVKDIIEAPPQGVRIYVVDVSSVYETVVACLSGDTAKCSALGLNVDAERFVEFEKRLGEIICGSAKCSEFDVAKHDLAFTLLWHLLYTRAIDLAKSFGVIAVPTQRPFWVYSGDSIQPITSSYISGWTPCILCGSEPAIIKFAKKPTERGEVTFDFQHSEGIPASADLKNLEREAHELESMFKPGEVLGPYCLLKRVLYFTKPKSLEARPRFASTDDIALEWKSRAVNVLIQVTGLRREFFNRVAEELVKKLRLDPGSPQVKARLHIISEALEGLLTPRVEMAEGAEKDIDIAARKISETLNTAVASDALVSRLSEALIEVCRQKADEVTPRLLSLVEELSAVGGGAASEVTKLMNLVKNWASKAESGARAYRASELCKAVEILTTFAILRSDADFIGDLHKGTKPLSLQEYISVLRNTISKELREKCHVAEGDVQRVAARLEDLMKTFNELSITEVLVSPARTSALSLSLMMQALEDAEIIERSGGILVFSGGDDVLALAPAQTALRVALELRKSFAKDLVSIRVGTSDMMLNVLRMHIPLGRSTSIRFANIGDLMNVEIAKAFELLEGVAKKAKWLSTGDADGKRKDSLIVSDSRISEVAVLPLNSEMIDLSEAGLGLALLMSVGALSSGLPEDFRGAVAESIGQLPSSALAKLFEYVLKRNVVQAEEGDKKFCEEVNNVLRSWLEKAKDCHVEINGKQSPLLSEVVSLMAILRRHI